MVLICWSSVYLPPVFLDLSTWSNDVSLMDLPLNPWRVKLNWFCVRLSLQKQVSVMSMNLSAKLDELQRGDRHLETTVALCEIRTQLQELTKSVESCQSEVSEVKRDMVAIKQELDTVQQVKEEIEELREYVDRLEEHTHRRKLRLLEQVSQGFCMTTNPYRFLTSPVQ